MLLIISLGSRHYIYRQGATKALTMFTNLMQARHYVRDMQRMERIISKRGEL